MKQTPFFLMLGYEPTGILIAFPKSNIPTVERRLAELLKIRTILDLHINYSGAQMKCNWQNLRFLNNWCCDLNESKCSPKVLSRVIFMRWFTGYKVCMVLPWEVYLWICQFWAFSINFFMESEIGHLKEPFFWVEYHFVDQKTTPYLWATWGWKQLFSIKMP